MPPKCPLCDDTAQPFFEDPKTWYIYWHCQNCDLHYLDPAQHLTIEKEYARYLLHQNSRGDLGYTKFLQSFLDWMQPELKFGERGLDFGSGPEPVLSEMLTERGFAMEKYDLFFAKNEDVFKMSFDFVVMSEVIEHLKSPRTELERLMTLLGRGGRLFVMTNLFDDNQSFADWSYRRDPTHIAFYSKHTLEWISRTLGFNSVRIKEPRWALFTL